MKLATVLLALTAVSCGSGPTAETPADESGSALTLGAVSGARVVSGCVADPMFNYPISRNVWYVRSGSEAIFFAATIPAGSHTATADVQWSLGSCSAGKCPRHLTRRLRVYLDGVVVAEDVTDGLENIVTQQSISASFSGGGCLKIGGYQVTRLPNGTGVGVYLLKKAASVE